VDPAYTQLLSPAGSSDDALLVCLGYLSDRKHGPVAMAKWVEGIRRAGWPGSIHHLWWDASNWGSFASDNLLLGPVGASLHWDDAKRRAKKTARRHTRSILEPLSGPRISVLAHSLGARLTYYMGFEAAAMGQPLRDVYLLGGALRRDSSKRWGDFADHLTGRVINVYNREDEVLGTLFRAAEWGNPCGRKPIKARHSRIINFDATKVIHSDEHGAYKRHLPAMVGPHFHR
jgi:hypothetical protein